MRKNYFKNILIAVLMIFTLNIFAQEGRSFWTESSKENASRKQLNFRKTEPTKAQFYNLNLEALKTYLADAPNRKSGVFGISEKLVSFPTSDNTFETYSVMEASVMEETLQQKYSNIRTYVGKSIDNPTNTMRFSITPQGLHTMSFVSGKGLEFIDPYTKDAGQYIVYSKKDLPRLDTTWTCDFEDDEVSIEAKNTSVNTTFNANDGIMREFRLALACTIEYAQFHWSAAGLTAGDSVAARKAAVLAAMVVTINRNNFIYERDLSVTMTLVANNENIIFINSDSFSNDNAGALINESQTVIDLNIGFSNYDIGHTFSTGGGGLAQLNSPCTNNKARGITGSAAPIGDPYDVDYVAHEMGHQYGATHTFNGSTGNCSGSNRTASSAYEPGSGTTIMAYAGICAPQNVQSNSDAYFHQKSLEMMWANITTGNSTCASQTATGNSAPTANAGANYTIPALTPYKLTGSSTDIDGTSSHTYTWEQYDLGAAGLPEENNFSGPLVRSFEGTNNPTRYIPRLEEVVAFGGVSTTWEKLSSINRNINFRLTVRDNDPNGGQTAVDAMTATVNASAGPFVVTSQNTQGVTWLTGETQTITWDVAGTTANGINTANVNILLSTDGGQNFDTVLASNVPNDGSHDIIVPNVFGPYSRVMVEGAGNIFFNINSEDFQVNASINTTCVTYSSGNVNIPIPDGPAANTQGTPIFNTINIPDPGNVDEILVSVDVTHSWVGDLLIQVSDPNGTEFTNVWARSCNDAQYGNIDVTFDDNANPINCATPTQGTYAPAAPLSVFNGLDQLGDWQIAMADFYNGDTGTLNSWSIDLCSTTITNLSTEEFSLSGLSIFPNPNNGQFTVKFNNAKDVKLEVYDVRGRAVLSQDYNVSGQFNETINLGSVQSGMYLLKVNNGGKTITKKIIVE
ncbi:reprolysin-like metallopeptidase [Mesoflavibacter sp. CH_XMU1422-2]|uniref:reprolysin-like metallopeptidase n=1 Tax=Mesoflavibacter sp. CH_XMU1422-2 TaxID=3107770 RepID=UPI00300AFF73